MRFALLLVLALPSCNLFDGRDDPRACTEEFCTYFVQVLDQADRPVTGLTSTVRVVRTGEMLAFDGASPSDDGFGYPVASDAHRDQIREEGDTVVFTAEGEGRSAEATFEFYDDGCHIVKRSGPERIVAEPVDG